MLVWVPGWTSRIFRVGGQVSAGVAPFARNRSLSRPGHRLGATAGGSRQNGLIGVELSAATRPQPRVRSKVADDVSNRAHEDLLMTVAIL